MAAEQIADAVKTALLPRPPKPLQTHPFCGSIWNSDSTVLFGHVDGLFYRGLEKGDGAWRGEFCLPSDIARLLRTGDTVTLRRDGRDDSSLVVMIVDGERVAFRCRFGGAPIDEVDPGQR